MKYVITGLPRSRTAWFAAYFDIPHEAISRGLPWDEGTADSGFALAVEDPSPYKLVIIERPMINVVDSLNRIGISGHAVETAVTEAQRRLRKMNGLRIPYSEVDERIIDIHEYLEIPWNPYHYDRFAMLRIVAKDFE